jgi:hypothetical protein
MMWTTQDGMMGTLLGYQRPRGTMTVSPQQATRIAPQWLAQHQPGATIEAPDQVPGDDTLRIHTGGIITGMLSVNVYSEQVWSHTGHGAFIRMKDLRASGRHARKESPMTTGTSGPCSGRTTTSAAPYPRASALIRAALKEQGGVGVTEIDVRTTRKETLGADVRPYLILGACNPPLAQRALQADLGVGLLLPGTVVAYDNGHGVQHRRGAGPHGRPRTDRREPGDRSNGRRGNEAPGTGCRGPALTRPSVRGDARGQGAPVRSGPLVRACRSPVITLRCPRAAAL